jgi:Domain of unknown function (DUF1707)
MSPTSSQQWTRRIRYSDQHIRVSDADRNAVAERLAAHYGDGRLDQAEFDERVSRAMSAKTRGDLDGLFDDLPDPEPAGASGSRVPGGPAGPALPYRARRHRGGMRSILVVALVIALAIAVGHTIAAVFLPWFWVAVIFVAIVVVSRSSFTHHDR